MRKRLYRSRTDCKFAGVCGGLGEYYDVDPTLIRIITVILFFAHGIGLLAYIIAWIAMPKEPLQAILDKATPVEQAQKTDGITFPVGKVYTRLDSDCDRNVLSV